MIAALLLASGTFLATVPWGEYLISWLQRHGFGKQIRAEGPSTHEAKRGTPTMGGILILLPVLLIGGVMARNAARLWAPLAVTAIFAALGAVDDVRGLRDRAGVGWLARFKFPWQVALALVGAWLLYRSGAPTTAIIPVIGRTIDLGAAYVPVAAFVIVSTVNAVNLHDGLDGMAGGTVAMSFVAFALIALGAGPRNVDLALLCAVFIGAIMAFLWYNVHPARVFMGDLGALGLGAGLASVALLTGYWLLLPVVGLVLVLEVVADILQVAYFKLTRGRRIFRMAPLHCHFELCGWPETRIVLRAWILTAVTVPLGVVLAMVK
ncbi:MAG: phospho-N-acetylmuramoyl-pentapeptide-transferase [Anaerolineae bacterium]|nr:phospho-N-acetylmuramoyl-pentapeptide-transferase [Anaerolineae bacterium]